MAGVTPRQIYQALTAAGFSTVQAIGLMANGIAESGLNPETRIIDSNGFHSDGIWQFNEQTYPNAGSLVTGHPQADMHAQVGFLKAHVSGQALQGSTGGQVAGNFAQFFERCQTCQPGGESYKQRVGFAAEVAGWVRSGHWPTVASPAGEGGGAAVPGAGGDGGGSGSGGTATGNRCMIQFPGVLGIGKFCLLSKGEARALIGGGLMVLSGGAALVGVIILAAAAFRRTGALERAADVAAVVPGGGAAAEGLTVAHRRVTRSGSQAASERRGARVAAERQQSRRQRQAAQQETQARRTAAQQQRRENAAARRAAGSPASQRRAIQGQAPRRPRPPAQPRQPAAVHH